MGGEGVLFAGELETFGWPGDDDIQGFVPGGLANEKLRFEGLALKIGAPDGEVGALIGSSH